ncbi:MAG: flagellar filament capping protein FliD [Deltaproteobacteria bacterium]|nr:flagellar filament capping protein FliD [Deltaproteobacteria bacterium]
MNQLVAVERQPIARLQTQRSAKASQAQQVQALTDKLRKLQTLTKGLETSDKMNATSVTTSATGNLTATSTGLASPGSYSVRVAQLAKAQRTYSDGTQDKSTAGVFGAGTISVTVGQAAAVNVTVDPADTLESISEKLNAVSGVSSSIVYDGSSYRLQVAGLATGAANTITFSEQGTTLGLSKPDNQVVAAQDARVSIDGFTVTSATNTLAQAVPGLSLKLSAVTDGATYDTNTGKISGGVATELSVGVDAAAIKQKIKDMVTALNDVNASVKAFSTSQKNPDAGVQSITARLRAVIGAPVSGLDQTLSALSQVGVSTNRDGTLSLDETKLDGLLAGNPTGVTRLFVTSSGTTGVASKLDDAIDAFVNGTTGTLVAKKQSMDRSVSDMDKRLDVMNRALDAYQTRVQKQFSAMEQAVTKLNQAANVFATKA